GVAVADSTGNFRNFLDVISDMQPRLEKLRKDKRSKFLLDAFGAEGLAGVTTIMTQLQDGLRTSTGEFVKGAAVIAYYREQFANAEGAAARLRETMLAGLKGQSKLLWGSIKTLAIDMGMPFVEMLTPVVHAVTALLNQLIRVIESMSPGVRRFVAGVVVAAVA